MAFSGSASYSAALVYMRTGEKTGTDVTFNGQTEGCSPVRCAPILASPQGSLSSEKTMRGKCSEFVRGY